MAVWGKGSEGLKDHSAVLGPGQCGFPPNFLLGNLEFVRVRGAVQLMSSIVVCVISYLRGGARGGVDQMAD